MGVTCGLTSIKERRTWKARKMRRMRNTRKGRSPRRAEAKVRQDSTRMNSRRRFWVQGGRGGVRPDFATAYSLLFESWLSGLHATALYIYSTVS